MGWIELWTPVVRFLLQLFVACAIAAAIYMVWA